MECPNCNDYVDEQGVCHTCQTQTVKPCKHDRTINEGDAFDVILYCLDCKSFIGDSYK